MQLYNPLQSQEWECSEENAALSLVSGYAFHSLLSILHGSVFEEESLLPPLLLPPLFRPALLPHSPGPDRPPF